MAEQKLYALEVMICATAYVRAEGEDEANVKADVLVKDECFELAHTTLVSDKQYDDPSLPDASLSPACTGIGLTPGSAVNIAWQKS